LNFCTEHLVQAGQDGDDDSGQQRLLRAAATEFAEHGYAGTSIAGIAGRAGVSKSTVFHHFESKQSLYLAVIQAAAREFGHKLDALLSDPAQPAEGVTAFQQAHLNHIRSHPQVATLVLRELQGQDPDRSLALVRDVLWPNFNKLVRFLDDAAAAGVIRAGVDPHAVALTLLSANVMFFQTEQILKRLPGFDLANDPATFASAVSDLVLFGLEPKEKAL
jgi:TetR/AcrR family transcriptional regulator